MIGPRHSCFPVCGKTLEAIIDYVSMLGPFGDDMEVVLACQRRLRKPAEHDIALTCVHRRVYWLLLAREEWR